MKKQLFNYTKNMTFSQNLKNVKKKKILEDSKHHYKTQSPKIIPAIKSPAK